MSFSNIKSFIKEYWTAFVTLLLGIGQIYLLIYSMQQAAYLLVHSDKTNTTFVTILVGCWFLTLALSIAFPTIVISHQANTIKKLQAEIKQPQEKNDEK
ncbi:hypothetical protein LMB49_10775 [Limosilactobacillus reuteri]|uniref:hypothetical protein n=1 Tax=Limosilactobacillus reuteri TaxID=1598 RepID=UPI001E415137|nr:hypothetical protein [Limosilactobacillus reuteri]MCC4370556.1 hypothetical protein [Limosilactobacillus reuteri]MCC4371875.1 hypothetical protein [Limosilactobacillus reuteri]MCC4509346.1 hypothetical protein [Limosilactobacillus reuteri]MCC4509389.1 hypothetical protein [Limosilactobacillus reuteri]